MPALPSPRAAAVVTLLGLAATAVGAFALPLQTASDLYGGQDISFVVVRENVERVNGTASGFGEFWWRYGLFLALALLLLGSCLLVLQLAVRAAAVTITALGVLALAGQGAALAQTYSFWATLPDACRRPDVSCSVSTAGTSMYDHAAVGIWVAYAGLFVVVAGGLLGVLTGSRRAD